MSFFEMLRQIPFCYPRRTGPYTIQILLKSIKSLDHRILLMLSPSVVTYLLFRIIVQLRTLQIHLL